MFYFIILNIALYFRDYLVLLNVLNAQD